MSTDPTRSAGGIVSGNSEPSWIEPGSPSYIIPQHVWERMGLNASIIRLLSGPGPDAPSYGTVTLESAPTTSPANRQQKS